MSDSGPVVDVPALFGYNLMYDQPLIKMKHVGNQRMNAVCYMPVIWVINQTCSVKMDVGLGFFFFASSKSETESKSMNF